ncbi:conserved protein of unknown function [Ruminococcaceae bacterium BL-6]|nr:conserved protein of unknown function [Ruminococcaceae bacterium BL-6]
MSNHAIVRLDNISALHNGALIKSVKYFVGDTATNLDNGNIVALSGLMAGEREIYKAVAPATATRDILLACGVELMYDESTYHGLEDYQNEAGKPFRAIALQSGDTFSATVEAFDSTPVVGNYVTVAAGSTKLTIKAEVTTETVLGKIVAIDVVGPDTYYVVSVA